MTFDIPNKDGFWMFTSPNTWQTWVKPNQYNNFMIYVCGGGGGGRGGAGLASGAFYGGPGGAGGQFLTINAPSFLLPENLYINIGLGGAGGTSGGGYGSAGGTSYLCYYPNTNAANVIAPASGGAASALNSPNGGVIAAAFTNQTIFSITSSQSAGANAITGGTGNFSSTACCIYGGASGGGRDASNVYYDGGAQIGSNIHPTLFGSLANNSGVNGGDGYFIKKPFTALGGAGSGSSSTTPGRGGNGIFGSGGGGGGISAAGGGTNRGGRGGDGFIIIIGY